MARGSKQQSRHVARPGRTGAARWRKLIDEQAKGDLSQQEYCEKMGVSVHSFRDWKYRRLKAPQVGVRDLPEVVPLSTHPTSTPGFVPVEVVFDTTPEPRAPQRPAEPASPGSGVEVLLADGVRVGVRSGFDPSVLRQVVEVLGC
jgi:hypothetical protein